MTDTERMEELLAAERAAEWLRRLKSGGPEVHAEFGRWLRESPRNVRDILLATAYEHALKHMKSQHRVDVQAIKHRCADTVREITSSDAHPPARHHTNEAPRSSRRRALDWGSTRNRGGWRTAAGVAFLALVSLMTVAIYAVSDRTISTAAGEWHTTQLPDGTILRAGPRTKATVDFTEHQRVVRLMHGELMLHVAKDRARPFSVETDLATARAVGTAFAVRRMERERVSVTVKEGVVAVTRRPDPGITRTSGSVDESVMVRADEQVQVTAQRHPLSVVHADIGKELAWVTGRMVFDDDTTVADAIRELNLRNETQIKLLSPELARRHFRGVIEITGVMELARTLERQGSVSIVNDRSGTLLLVPYPAGENSAREQRSP